MANFRIPDRTYIDLCLEDVYLSYKNEIFDPSKEDKSLNGDNYYPEDYQVDAPDWLFSEAKLAVYNITQQIRNDIHLDPEINYMNYPNPADAMRATAHDLTARIEANQSSNSVGEALFSSTEEPGAVYLPYFSKRGDMNLKSEKISNTEDIISFKSE